MNKIIAKFSGALADIVGEEFVVHKPSASILEIAYEVESSFDGLSLTMGCYLQPYITTIFNGEIIPYSLVSEYELLDSDEVLFMTAMAGG